VLDSQGNVIERGIFDENEAVQKASNISGSYKFEGSNPLTTLVHSIKITPEMRSSVMQGQPLFSQPLNEQLKEFRANPNKAEVFAKITVNQSDDVVGGSFESAELMRIALANVQGHKVEATAIIDGLYIEQDSIPPLLKVLDNLITELDDAGNAKAADNVDAVAEAIENASKASVDGSVIFAVTEKSLKHERLHKIHRLNAARQALANRYENTKTKTGFNELYEANKDTLEKAFNNDLGARYFAGKDFETLSQMDKAVLFEEARVAFLNYDNLGLTDDEASTFLFNELEAYTAIHGDDIIKDIDKIINGFGESYENYKNSIEAVEQGNLRVEPERSNADARDGEASKKPVGGVQATEEDEQKETGFEVSERLSDKVGVTETREVGQKKAAFSRILGKDYYYNPQTHEDTDTAAQQLITDKGVQQVIDDVLDNTRPSAASMRVVYWELGRLNGVLDHHLEEGNTTEANIIAKEIADLSAKIVARQLANGRETEIAKVIEPLSAESVYLTAIKLKRIWAGDDGAVLTPIQIQTINDLATKAEKLQKELESVQEKHRQAQAEIARLSDDTKASSKPLRASRKIADVKKSYNLHKEEIRNDLARLFPESPLFNGKNAGLQQSGSVLKSVVPSVLNQEQVDTLKLLAAGEIANDTSYKSLMKTLSDLTGLKSEHPELKQIHADAVASIKDEGEVVELTPEETKKLDEKKSVIKLRAEHTRKATTFRKKAADENNLSGIAQDAENSDVYNDPNLVHAIDLLTNAKYQGVKNINAFLNKVQEDLGITIQEAKALGIKAKEAEKAIKTERAAERDRQKGISAEFRQEMNALTVERRKASTELTGFLKQIHNPQWVMQRANNSFRAKFVNNHITQAFNFLQGAIIGGGVNGALIDPITLAVNGVSKRLGLEFGQDRITDGRARDLWRPMAYLFGANKQLSEGLLAHLPTEWERIHTALFGDVILGDSVSTEAARNKVTKAIHKILDKDDKLNVFLGTITGAKWQEMHVRYALFRASIDSTLLARSDGKNTLASLQGEDVDLMDYLTEKDISLAVDKALQGTFASMIDDPVGKALKRTYDQIDHVLPVFFNPITYAKFTYVTSKTMVVNPLLLGALDLQGLGGKGYSPRSVAQGVLAWGGVVMAAQIMSAFGGDDDKWETLYIFGKDAPPLNIKRFFPISAYFYMAHLIRNYKADKPMDTKQEWLEGFASIESQYFEYGAGLDFASTVGNQQTLGGNKDSSDLGRASARLTGNILAGFLRVMSPAKIALSQFDDQTGLSESNYRTYDATAQAQFMEEVNKTLPFLSTVYGAEKNVDAVTGKEVRMPSPLSKVVGISRIPLETLKPKKTAATLWAEKLFPFNYEAEWTPESKKSFAVKESIKKAAQTGSASLDVLDEKVMEFVNKGTLTPKQGNLLRKEMRLTPLQSKIKSGFTVNTNEAGQKDMKALQRVWEKSTDQEKQDIRMILQAKENRTPEFNKEFDLSPAMPKKRKK
jgi:hypothetical protein